MKRKKKKINYREKALTAFQRYVRLRDCDENGYAPCISCGTFKLWDDCHGGHFVSRRHNATAFDERNVNAQCVYCNLRLKGNGAGYANGIIKKYGHGVIEELNRMKETLCKYSDEEFKEMRKAYENSADRIKAEKNL
jgi:hypothetical protein